MSDDAGWPDGVDPAAEDPDAEYVEDIGALRRAEEAVAHDEPITSGAPVGLDEEWLPVARTSTWPAGLAGLEEVAEVLAGERIPIGWDPHDPHENPVGFLPAPGIWPGSRSTFALLVQASRLDDARRALAGPAPPWVTYGPDGAPEGGESQSRSQSRSQGPGRRTDAAAARPPVADMAALMPRASGLSDNARLEAGPSSPGAAVALAFAVLVLLAVAVVAYLVTRG